MNTVRIIPRLDIKGPNLVKGIHLEGLRVLGAPDDFAKFYYENGADELIYIDSVASLYERNNLTDIIQYTAKNVFIPLTVGGGIRTLEDISNVLRAGADKVAVNTEAVNNPIFLNEAVKVFGSQCIVLYVEAKKIGSNYYAFTHNAREKSDRIVTEWIAEAQDLGVGEVLLTSIDREGTGKGFDCELINSIKSKLSIPLIVNGGAGNIEDVVNLLSETEIEAVACSSIFHYNQQLINYEKLEKNKEGVADYFDKVKKNFLNTSFNRIKPCSIIDLKQQLKMNNINCRIEEKYA